MTEPPSGRPARYTRVLFVGLLLVALWLVARYLWGILLPFLLAYLLARPIRPLVDRLTGGRREGGTRAPKSSAFPPTAAPLANPPGGEGGTDPAPTACRRREGHLPRGVVAGVLVALLTGGTLTLVISGVRRGLNELTRLAEELARDREGVLASLSALLERARSVSAHIPLLRRFEDAPGYADLCARLDLLVGDGIDRLAKTAATRLSGTAVAFAEALPAAFVFVTVLLLAAGYFAADDGRLSAGAWRVATRLLPPSVTDALPPLGRRLSRLGKGYLRACGLLGLLTFLEAFIGLSVLRIRYAFLLAVLIALVDTLPLLGTGVILIPWGLGALLLGHPALGVGLLILYGICTILRQLLEPRLLGQGLGLHPLLSLFAMYAGLRLFGIWGMLAGPFVAALVKVSLGEGDWQAS